MSEEGTTYVKKNLFSISTLFVLIGFIIHQSKWQQNVDNRLQVLERHSADKEMHMPFRDKIQVFVPRIEIDVKLENIDKSLQEIKADLKKSLNF